jgi:FkbM family methyltransferase
MTGEKSALQNTIDPFTRQLLLLGDLRGGVIFDVGANVGGTTEQYIRRFSQSVVHAFEPAPAVFSELQTRFEGVDRVRLHNLAVSDTDGVVDLFVNKNPATNSLFSKGESSSIWADEPDSLQVKEIVRVDSVSLDTFCDESDVAHVDILKFDIQGGELRALHGCKRLLAEKRIDLIYAELLFVPVYEGAPYFDDVCGHLRTYGYMLYDFYHARYAPSGQLKWLDAIFLGPSLHEKLCH